MNNFERIKSMTVDEMAEFLEKIVLCNACPLYMEEDDDCGLDCRGSFKRWLLSEVTNENKMGM